MQVQLEEVDQLRRKMSITVPNDEVEEEIEERLKEAAKSAQMRGFRPGKVPMRLIKAQYGESVKQEVMQELIKSTYPMALHEHELEPINTGEIEIVKEPDNGQDFTYEITFETQPTIELPDLTEMTFDKYVPQITDEDIELHLERLREQYARYNDLDRPAQTGDYVNVTYYGKLNGEPLDWDWAKEEEVTVKLGDQDLLSEIEEALVGMSAGETKTVQAQSESVDTNQLTEFEVTLNKVQERELPELNDEFAQNLEQSNFNTLEELKEDIKNILEDQMKQHADEKLQEDILDELSRQVDFPSPQSLIDQEIERIRKSEENSQQESSLSGEEIEKQAKENVHKGLIFNTYLKQNDIQVDRQRVDQYIESLASNFGLDTQTIKNAFYSRDEDLSRLEDRVLREQGAEDMASKVQVNEIPISAKEFEEKNS